jgi:hypothetical protein
MTPEAFRAQQKAEKAEKEEEARAKLSPAAAESRLKKQQYQQHCAAEIKQAGMT